jgi:hypothetical protein
MIKMKKSNSKSETGVNFLADTELYKKVKVKCALTGYSLKEYFINLAKEDLRKDGYEV